MKRIAPFLLPLSVAILAACGDSPSTASVPDVSELSKGRSTGTLEVRSATTGADLDPDGYTVRVNSGSEKAIGINGSVSYSNLSAGDYRVELLGVASNCTVGGTNPRTVSITAGGKTATTFEVSCTALAKQYVVGSNSSPIAGDTIAITAQLADANGQPVRIEGKVVTWSSTEGGSFASPISTTDAQGVASGLFATSTTAGTTHIVSVTDATGLTGTSGSIVTRAGPAAGLAVVTQPSTAAQSGVEFAEQPVVQLHDANGNAVALGGLAVTVAIVSGGGAIGGTTTVNTVGNGYAAFTDLSINGTAGDRRLGFSAPDLTGTNSNTISVSAGAASILQKAGGDGQSAAVGTAVAIPPSVRVADASGNPVAGVSITFSVASGNGSVTGASATSDASGTAVVGTWTLGPAAGENTLTASATGLANVTFTGTGVVTTGTLEVRSATTGADLDPDGYTVRVNGGSEKAIGINGTVSYPNLSAGDYRVELLGVASNCTVAGANPRTVSVSAGSAVQSAFEVSCIAQSGTGVQEVVVRVLSVGKGDAALITNGNSKVIIDGGPDRTRFGALLDSLGLNNSTIDAVILSHGHGDHYSGLRELFVTRRQITVRNFYDNKEEPLESALNPLRDSVKAREARGELVYRSTYDPCADGSAVCTLRLDGGAKVHLLRARSGGIENNRSAPVKVVGPDSASFTMWFAGDAEQTATRWFEETARYHVFPGMKVNVLKGNHHGNCGAITSRYLQLTTPDLVVFPTGTNPSGYVHTQTKDLLTSRATPWYRTDQNGTITITSPGTPGGGYTVSARGGTNLGSASDYTSTDTRCNPLP